MPRVACILFVLKAILLPSLLVKACAHLRRCFGGSLDGSPKRWEYVALRQFSPRRSATDGMSRQYGNRYLGSRRHEKTTSHFMEDMTGHVIVGCGQESKRHKARRIVVSMII